jgi:hypothetical protein
MSQVPNDSKSMTVVHLEEAVIRLQMLYDRVARAYPEGEKKDRLLSRLARREDLLLQALHEQEAAIAFRLPPLFLERPSSQ